MFAIFTITGSSAAATHRLCGRSARSMRRATIACSARSLSERSSCSPRWSSTDGSALRRVEPASASVLARMPSRRMSSSGLAATNAASPRPAQKQKQDGNPSRSTPKTAATSCATGAWTWTSRASTIFSSAPGADALDRARDGVLVVLGRRAGGDDVAPDGVGVQQRQRRAAQLGEAPLDPREQSVGGIVGLDERGDA